MSATEPTKPYRYQPFGMQDREHWAAGRIYGVAGVSLLTTIQGLTSGEADAVVRVLLSGEDSDGKARP